MINMSKRWLLVLAVVIMPACSRNLAPSAPSPVVVVATPTPAPTSTPGWTLSGTVTPLNGHARSGVRVTFDGQTVETDAAGHYTLLYTASGAGLVSATFGSFWLERRLFIQGGRDRVLNLDPIALAAPFDVNFYRELARGGATNAPLSHLPASVRVYLRTVDDTGTAIDIASLDAVASTLQSTIGLWNGGRFGVGGIERGTGSRAEQAGWITINWKDIPGFCGQSTIGFDGGHIDFATRSPSGCRCGSTLVRPRTIRHELGHAMGFYHTSDTSDLMSGTPVAGCDALPSSREQFHAAIAYARPNGNTDPDFDPPTALTSSTARAIRTPITVSCPAPR